MRKRRCRLPGAPLRVLVIGLLSLWKELNLVYLPFALLRLAGAAFAELRDAAGFAAGFAAGDERFTVFVAAMMVLPISFFLLSAGTLLS